MKRALVIAFNNFENIVSHCKALAGKADITLVLMMNGKRYLMGTLDIDISDLKLGLTTDADTVNSYLPYEIEEYLQNSVKICFLKTKNLKLLKDYTLINFRTIRKAALYLRKKDYDLVHFNATGGFMLYFLHYFKKYKKIWTLHDYKAHSGEENRKSDIVNRIISKHDMHYIQFYEYLKNEFMKYYDAKPEKVHQIYTGKLDIYTYFKSKNKFANVLNKNDYILFFGRISRYKGIEYLIEGFNLYCNKKPESKLKLVIAGAGKFWFDINKIKNNPNIILINRFLDVYEHSELISNCKFVVAPYTDATHSAVVMTSYAFGKPVLASDVGGLKEVIKHRETGLLVEPCSSNAIAGGIEEMTENQFILDEYKKNIEKMCMESDFSWNKISDKLLSIYQSV